MTQGQLKKQIQEKSYEVESFVSERFIDLIEVSTVNKVLDEAKADFPKQPLPSEYQAIKEPTETAASWAYHEYSRRIEAWRKKWFGEAYSK